MSSWTRRAMSLNVDSFLRYEPFPDGFMIFQRADGSPMEPAEAMAHLITEKVRGHKVIPCSSECGKPCKNEVLGCTGFDFSGGGCPGYKVAIAP